jgi:hypothetical protein
MHCGMQHTPVGIPDVTHTRKTFQQTVCHMHCLQSRLRGAKIAAYCLLMNMLKTSSIYKKRNPKSTDCSLPMLVYKISAAPVDANRHQDNQCSACSETT